MSLKISIVKSRIIQMLGLQVLPERRFKRNTIIASMHPVSVVRMIGPRRSNIPVFSVSEISQLSSMTLKFNMKALTGVRRR